MKTRFLLLLLFLMPSWGVRAQLPTTQCFAIALAGGTGNSIVLPNNIPCWPSTTLVELTISATNTSSSLTIQVGKSTAYPFVNFDQTPIAAGALQPNQRRLISFTGSNWVLLNAQSPNTASGNVIGPTSPIPNANDVVLWNGETNVKDGLNAFYYITGVDLTGAVDDRAAIQAQIDAAYLQSASNTAANPTIVFPPGIYGVSAPGLKYYQGQSLIGASGTSFKALAAEAVWQSALSPTASAINCPSFGCNGGTLTNINVNMNSFDGTGILVEGFSNTILNQDGCTNVGTGSWIHNDTTNPSGSYLDACHTVKGITGGPGAFYTAINNPNGRQPGAVNNIVTGGVGAFFTTTAPFTVVATGGSGTTINFASLGGQSIFTNDVVIDVTTNTNIPSQAQVVSSTPTSVVISASATVAVGDVIEFLHAASRPNAAIINGGLYKGYANNILDYIGGDLTVNRTDVSVGNVCIQAGQPTSNYSGIFVPRPVFNNPYIEHCGTYGIWLTHWASNGNANSTGSTFDTAVPCQNDSATSICQSNYPAGFYLGTTTFTTPGVNTFNPISGAGLFDIVMQAAGGGGGGASGSTSTTNGSVGAPGSSGRFIEFICLDPSAINMTGATFTLGAAGLGSSAANGTDGTDTTMTTTTSLFSATAGAGEGGVAGGGAQTAMAHAGPSVHNMALSGCTQIAGGVGSQGESSIYSGSVGFAGHGGDAPPFGRGGLATAIPSVGTSIQSAGNNGTGFGSGGSGGVSANSASGTNQAGGNGAGATVVIKQYALGS